MPQGAVREVIEVDPGAVRTLENNEIMPHRGGVLPLVRLAGVFGLAGAAAATACTCSSSAPARAAIGMVSIASSASARSWCGRSRIR